MQIEDKLPYLNTWIPQILKEAKSHIPGVGVGIIHQGQLVYCQGFGFANIEKKTPINSKTNFRLASISKLFTTIGILQLWEQRKLDLDDPVNKYLPKGKILKKDPNWPDVTFRHLLTHRSGIGELTKKSDIFKAPGFGLNVKWPQPIPPLKTLHDKNITPEIPAGQKYAYCNIGFSLLGYLIECISGEEFVEYMHNHILNPLMMDHTDFVRSEKVMNTEAQGYVRKGNGYKNATYWQGIIKPAGMLISNLEDMAKFLIMLNRGGKVDKIQIIKEDTLKMAWTPQYATHPLFLESYAIGLGFQLYKYHEYKIMEHNGATSGFISSVSIIPKLDLGIMVFGNLDEIFHKDHTLTIKNLVLRYLLGADSSQLTIPTLKTRSIQTMPNASLENVTYNWKGLCGIYAPYPGILTNTRILQIGAEYRIFFEKNQLNIKALYGADAKKRILIPTENQTLWETVQSAREGINPMRQYAFDIDQNGEATHISWGFFRLRKISFIKSLRFKLGIGTAAIVGCIISGFILFL